VEKSKLPLAGAGISIPKTKFAGKGPLQSGLFSILRCHRESTCSIQDLDRTKPSRNHFFPPRKTPAALLG
jgi:hypothetical protein